MATLGKIGRYDFLSEPFHCDFSKKLFMGHLGNHLLNAADFHSNDRDFGMNYLNPIHKTWVLSRLAIEMDDMPAAYEKFSVETWVESALRFFTNRNFRICSTDDSRTYGYGKSVWAMIDTETRQPLNILAIRDGEIERYIEKDKECPIEGLSRVKMGKEAKLARTIDTYYCDVDVARNFKISASGAREHGQHFFAALIVVVCLIPPMEPTIGAPLCVSIPPKGHFWHSTM